MPDDQARVAELTVEELVALIRRILREELEHQGKQKAADQSALLDLAPLHVGEWSQELRLLSRDEYYKE